DEVLGGQEPNPGPVTPGPTDPGPTDPEPEVPYELEYGNLEATFGDTGQLYTGKGNNALGFAKSVNESAGIELGLDVRYYKDQTDVAPGSADPLERAQDLRFAYSVSKDGGINLDEF